MQILQWRKSNIRFSNFVATVRPRWLGLERRFPKQKNCFDSSCVERGFAQKSSSRFEFESISQIVNPRHSQPIR